MKDEIYKIKEMDQLTKDNERETEEKIEALKKETREKIASLEKEILQQGKEEGQKAYDQWMALKEENLNKAQKNRQEILKSVDQIYAVKREELIEKAFGQLIGHREEIL